ncbi:MAG: hypothetical protein ACRDOY_09480 [Nocardioidaceae bacterium]
MPAPTIAAIGLVLVLLDLRPEGRDWVPDSLGYTIAAVGFVRLAGRERMFGWAGLAAAAAAVLGLVEYVPGLLAGTAATVLVLGYNLMLSAMLALAGVAFARCAERAGEHSVARQTWWVARLAVVTWLALLFGVLLSRVAARAGDALVSIAAVGSLVALLWLLVLLSLRRTATCLTT